MNNTRIAWTNKTWNPIPGFDGYEDGKPCPKDQHDLLDGVKYQAYPKGWKKGE